MKQTRPIQAWTDKPLLSRSLYPTIHKALRAWWSVNQRKLPWRLSSDPYFIFVAEVLLQKTQVAKAEPAFNDLIRTFPDIKSLSQASLDDLEQLFSWLGLVKRAGYLLQSAQLIVEQHDAYIPNSLDDLKRLPGVGDYTANAVLCFAYGQAKPVVDSAIARVMKRLLGYQTNKKAWEDKITWALAEAFLDKENPVQHNYALIDLAALACAPSNPLCHQCPLQEWCVYFDATQSGTGFKT